VDRGYATWADYHRTLMRIVGQEVELVGVPLAELVAVNVPAVGICKEIFAYNVVYSSEKLFRDVPEFRPQHTLESAMRHILAAMDAVSDRTGAALAEIALAWIAAQPGITAPIASATSVEQVQMLARGARLSPSVEDLRLLTEAGR